MLVLLFQNQHQFYAIESNSIIQVIPNVPLNPPVNVPEYLIGFLDFHGQALPILDFALLIKSTSSPPMLHTRIILLQVHTQMIVNALPQFGLRAEKVIETLECRAEDFTPCGVYVENSPFLGGIWSRDEKLIQLIDIPKLMALTQGYLESKES